MNPLCPSNSNENHTSSPSESSDGVSRRDFLKASAAAAIPLALTPSFAAKALHVAGSDRIRIGLIGCGGRGTGAAAQALRADKGNILVAMGDIFADRIASSHANLVEEFEGDAKDKIDVPAERRFTGFDAYKKVLDAGVDMVCLTTIPAFRPWHLEAAVDAGKHIFCEKPMAVDMPGLRRVRAAAKKAKEKNLSLVAGFCWRYHDAMRATFQKIHDGAIGDVVTVHSTYHTGTLGKQPRKPEWTDVEFQLRNWWHFTWLSGDHIVEQAIHSIDRLSWAMKDKMPARALALGGRAARRGPESGHVFDHFAVVYEWDNGQRAFHTACQIDGFKPTDNRDYVYGTNGSTVINGWQGPWQMLDRSGKPIWKYEGQVRDMYQNEHDALFAGIRSGKHIYDGDWMADSCHLGLMGRMAAYTGQTVSWADAENSQESLVPDDPKFGDMPVPPVAVPGQTKLV